MPDNKIISGGEVVLEAVRYDGLMIMFASEELQNDPDGHNIEAVCHDSP